MSAWNHPAQFQFDSADLPFLPHPPQDYGSLESSTPFWKVSSITEMERAFTSSEESNSSKEVYRSPFMRMLSTSSHSNDSMFNLFGDDGISPFVQKTGQESHRRVSQSLPVTPFSTPGPTPLSTPQNSPTLHRKAEMDSICKAASRCADRLSQDQSSQHLGKWFYMGFMQQGSGKGEVCMPSDKAVQQMQTSKTPPLAFASSEKHVSSANEDNAVSDVYQVSSGANSRLPRRKYKFVMSNRDMNFLAPTSM